MSKNILIVDDEQIIRNVLKRKLEQATNYNVLTAEDGVPALELFKQHTIDLVISDLLMSKMNGIELLRNIKQLDSKVPVIIITGFGTLDDAIEAIKLGAEDFIKKPFDINEVISTIDKTFRKLEEEADQRAIIKHISTEDIRLEIPTDFDFLNKVINYIFSHLRARWLISSEDLHDVKVCLYEALYNALEHGSLGITEEEKSKLLEQSQQAYKDFLVERLQSEEYKDKKIEVTLWISDEDIAVAITDEGSGFDHVSRIGDSDPEALFKSSGRGLLLIQSLMDEISFNEQGNQIRMVKKRSSVNEAAGISEAEGEASVQTLGSS
ncbi:response regulator [bacterium]|nr:response regulator [bacterium]